MWLAILLSRAIRRPSDLREGASWCHLAGVRTARLSDVSKSDYKNRWPIFENNLTPVLRRFHEFRFMIPGDEGGEGVPAKCVLFLWGGVYERICLIA